VSVGAAAPLSADSHTAVPPPHLQCPMDQADGMRAADQLQACIDAAPDGSVVDIPSGTYVLDHQIRITRPVTLRSPVDEDTDCWRLPDACATLIAASTFADAGGLITVTSTHDVTLSAVIIDGNRTARLHSAAARNCARGLNSFGFNASVIDCARCSLNAIVSRNALCGTGMEWRGAHALIQGNTFEANGDGSTLNMWSDGLTLLSAPYSVVQLNQFIDNSDVALIAGYGVQLVIQYNTIIQRSQRALAGLMLDNFDSDDLTTAGDFRGGLVAANSVDCGGQLCVFGVQAGPRPWYPTRNIVGGQVSQNVIRGAMIGINVDGAGVANFPTTIFGNVVLETPSAVFAGCSTPLKTFWMNISPASIVDRRRERLESESARSDVCQFWSSLSPAQP
jgi:hypothetical protein